MLSVAAATGSIEVTFTTLDQSVTPQLVSRNLATTHLCRASPLVISCGLLSPKPACCQPRTFPGSSGGVWDSETKSAISIKSKFGLSGFSNVTRYPKVLGLTLIIGVGSDVLQAVAEALGVGEAIGFAD